MSSTIPDTAGEPALLARLENDLGQYCTALTPGRWAVPDGRAADHRPPARPAATDALRFNPWTTGEGIVPVGRLNRRRPSYASSQQGRPARITRGVVHVLYGSAAGLTATGSQLWSQASPGVAGEPEGADFFGHVLAAGTLTSEGGAAATSRTPSSQTEPFTGRSPVRGSLGLR